VLIGAADACPACAASIGRQIPIADARPIPVAGCSFEICRCDWALVV
jgi:hypothetical protein